MTVLTLVKAADPHENRAQWLAEQIRLAILEHRLPPGTKLTEAILCELFNLKRNVVRQAFTLLSQEKLITIEPNRGAFVANPSLRDVHEIFEMRRIIEAAVVGKVAHHANTTTLTSLFDMIYQERHAFENHDFASWVRLSGEFHLALARLTGNNVLEECLSTLVARSTLISALYDHIGQGACSCDEHKAILYALQEGQADHATHLMQHHLQSCELKMLDRPLMAPADLRSVFTHRS